MAVSYKIMKYSALLQTNLGIFLMVIGFIDRIHMFRSYPTVAVVPVWMGFLIAITGFFGMGVGYGRPDGPKIPVLSRAVGKTKKSSYLGLSVMSCIFAGSIVVLYSHGFSLTATCPDAPSSKTHTKTRQQNENCHISHVVGGIIIVVAIVEFGASIWACVCCCYRSHRTLQQGQTVFIQNQQGQATAYIIDVIDPAGRAVVLRNPLDVLDNNPVGDQGLCNDGFVFGPPPPYTASDHEDVIEQQETVDPLPDAREPEG